MTLGNMVGDATSDLFVGRERRFRFGRILLFEKTGTRVSSRWLECDTVSILGVNGRK